MTVTISVQPLSRPGELTGELVQLLMFLNKEDFEGVYDRLEVWRSTLGQAGPYEELTDASVRGARIPKDAPDPPAAPVVGPSVALDTLELDLLINEKDELTILFSGTDPITYAAAAAQVDAQGTGQATAYVTAGGVFVLESVGAGLTSRLRVVGGDASAQLILPDTEPESLSFGKEARISLTSAQEQYQFTDPFGSAAFHYKTRFRNRSTDAVSEFSDSFTGESRLGITPDQLVLGQVDLVQAGGAPLAFQEVRIHTAFNGTLVEGKLMTGGDLIGKTDRDGHVEFVLVRGQKLTVSLPGTSLFRDITVPTDPDIKTFNLLDPAIAGEDIFKVAVPDLVFAERRTL